MQPAQHGVIFVQYGQLSVVKFSTIPLAIRHSIITVHVFAKKNYIGGKHSIEEVVASQYKNH